MDNHVRRRIPVTASVVLQIVLWLTALGLRPHWPPACRLLSCCPRRNGPWRPTPIESRRFAGESPPDEDGNLASGVESVVVPLGPAAWPHAIERRARTRQIVAGQARMEGRTRYLHGSRGLFSRSDTAVSLVLAEFTAHCLTVRPANATLPRLAARLAGGPTVRPRPIAAVRVRRVTRSSVSI